MPSKSLITVTDLTMGFGDVIVQRDLNFQVKEGEIFVILGGSGCGKSTLLKHMIGLYSPLKGSIEFEGEDIVQAQGETRQKLMRKFGVMYQLGALFGSLTLRENVRLPLEEFTDLPAEAMNMLALMKLNQVGLIEFGEFLPSEISGGMQKRAAIARAMALDPAILFLDEPSAGLDPITSAELDQLILQLSRSLGVTFVIVTHELPSIYTIADRVIMLDKQKKTIIAEGDPAWLRDNSNDPGVQQFFNRATDVDTMDQPTLLSKKR
jgi:phospholipid/cholesterol/gamma-HCH transport system ATP-binding protein